MSHRFTVFLCFLGILSHTGSAQDSATVSLPVMTVQSTRQLETYTTAARSIFVRKHDIIFSEPGLSLQRVLRGLPGTQISERGHFALGERILVRGMGYRAAFGVRGVQAFLNGIPLTMPDGQSMLDVVDPVFIGHSELLRGPSSLFWGNASGGVLHLASSAETSPLRIRYMAGSHGLHHALASTHFRFGPYQINAHASGIRKTGYRAHSKGYFSRAGVHVRAAAGPRTAILFAFNAAIQDVLSPGSLTLAQMSQNPRQADPRHVKMSAGKASLHLQTGVTLHRQIRQGSVTATAYGIRRYLENPLSFAWSELERIAGGLYAQFQINAGEDFGFTTGIDLRHMRDDRIRFNNSAGNRGNRTLLDQEETAGSLAVFAGLNVHLSAKFGFSAGARLDRLRFTMLDHLQADGDQGGNRTFVAFSPSVGVFYHTGTLTWYANTGTAFETPTTTELINSPSERGGFNSDLGPQQTLGTEAGVRGRLDHLRIELDLAIFSLRIRDRLLPQQSEDGRTWYVNGGKNRHRGAEIALEWPANSPAGVRISYSYGSFIFLNNPGKGRKIPGVPSHQLHMTLYGITASGWAAQIVLESASAVWGDNENSTQSDSFVVLDLYLSRSSWQISPHITLAPFVRIQNALNQPHVRSLVVNAFGGRYFEPAEGRSLQAGIGMNL